MTEGTFDLGDTIFKFKLVFTVHFQEIDLLV